MTDGFPSICPHLLEKSKRAPPTKPPGRLAPQAATPSGAPEALPVRLPRLSPSVFLQARRWPNPWRQPLPLTAFALLMQALPWFPQLTVHDREERQKVQDKNHRGPLLREAVTTQVLPSISLSSLLSA